IGKNLSFHFPVGIGTGMTSNGTSGGRSISADLEFTGEPVVHAISVHYDHDQIDCLPTKLKAPTTAGDGDRGDAAPLAVIEAAGGDTLSVAVPQTRRRFST